MRKASPTSTETADALMVSAVSEPLMIKLSALVPPPRSVKAVLVLNWTAVKVRVSVPLLLVSREMASTLLSETVWPVRSNVLSILRVS